ncbi:MAG: response regulator [Bacteroidetes bacterium]|nr:response regulator [Bacteroidota bacterium]
MEKIKILIIEDNKFDTELIIRELKKNNLNFEYKNVYKFEDVKREITENPPDIIFSDYQLQSFNGIEVLNFRNEHAPFTPFIKITGTLDEERAVEIIKSGADDYILKQNLSRLGPAVHSAIEKMYLNRQKNYAERKLKESEEKFSKIFHFSPVPTCILNFESGLIMDVNESFCDFSKYREGELIGSYIYDFDFFDSHHHENFVKTALKDKYVVKNYELEVGTKEGEKKFVLTNFVKITLDGIMYVVVKFVDITPHKLAEIELNKAKERAEEMNKLKTTFLTNLSHEFRTPLNGILGFSDMLANELVNEEHKSYIEAIRTSGQRLLDTFNDLIDLSVIESGKIVLRKEAVNLVNTTQKIFNHFKGTVRKEIELQLEIKSENLICTIDLEGYEKIIYKLLGNAIKFTHRGYVKVVLDKVLKDGHQYIFISVKDSGIGISPEDLEIVFHRFRQSSEGIRRNYEGTGIGLSIAQKFVELMGGTISVTSKVGAGSEFIIEIPVNSRNGNGGTVNNISPVVYYKENGAKEITKENFSDKNKKILLVEDNDVDCFYINKLLSDKFQLTIVKDSLKAQKYYSSEKFDLIMLDIHFNSGINGVEVLKGIKNESINHNTPVIASTALAMAGDKEKLLTEGFDDYIQKPFDKHGLIVMLKKYLKK